MRTRLSFFRYDVTRLAFAFFFCLLAFRVPLAFFLRDFRCLSHDFCVPLAPIRMPFARLWYAVRIMPFAACLLYAFRAPFRIYFARCSLAFRTPFARLLPAFRTPFACLSLACRLPFNFVCFKRRFVPFTICTRVLGDTLLGVCNMRFIF